MHASPPEPISHEALQPFREKLLTFLKAKGPGDDPISIPFGHRQLHIAAWERSILHRAALGDPQEGVGVERLVLDATAAQLALIVGLERSPEFPTDQADPARDCGELAGIAAIAEELLEDLRASLEGLIASGRLDDAKRLSASRNTFAALVQESRRVLGTTAGGRREPPGRPRGDDARTDDGVADASPPVVEEQAGARYREGLAAYLRAQGPGTREITIPVGTNRLTATAWERQILWRLLCEGAPPSEAWHELLAEGFAAQLAVLLALERQAAGGAAADSTGSRNQVEDALRLATGVLERLRATSDAMVGQGAMEPARRLSSFRNRVGDTINEARRALEGQGHAISPAPAPPPAPRAMEPAEPSTMTVEPAAAAEEGAEDAPPQAHEELPLDLLDGWRERLQTVLAATGAGMPVAIPAGSRSVTLSPWEARVLRSALTRPAGYEPWHLVLANGVALELTTLETADHLGEPAPSLPPGATLDSPLERVAGISSILLERTQRAIDELVGAGAIDDAKRLSAWRNRMQVAVKDSKPAAGVANQPAAELLAGTTEGEPAPGAPASPPSSTPFQPGTGSEDEAEGEVSESEARLTVERALRARRRAAAARRWRRLRTMLLVLTVVAAVFAAVVLIPRVTERRLRELTLADFSQIAGITAVDARPPSLYVTVSPTTWSLLNDNGRRSLVAGFGAVLASESYTGATFSTPDGRIVAEWLKSRGVEILPQPAVNGPPT